MMRNRKKAAYLCTVIVLLMTAGCGSSDTDSDVSTVDTINFNDVIDIGAEENNSNNQNIEEDIDNQQDSDTEEQNAAKTQNATETHNTTEMQNVTEAQGAQLSTDEQQQNSNPSQVDNTQSQSDSELDGSIESIADNSMIINKTFHPSANVSVTYEDASEKVLVTVYFTEETEFEVWTVKNGGVNGEADTEKRQGAFSDLKQDASVDMIGSYDGNDFYAEHIIIYSFI